CSPGRVPRRPRFAAARGGESGAAHSCSSLGFAFLTPHRSRAADFGPFFFHFFILHGSRRADLGPPEFWFPTVLVPAPAIWPPWICSGGSPAWLPIPRRAQPCQGPKARPRSEAEGLTRQARRGQSAQLVDEA